MSRDELLSLAERLRNEDPISTEEREFLAGELDRMAAATRGPGRPKDSPLERALRKRERRRVADAIYHGTLPSDFYPSNLDLAVKQAKGKRTEADEVAAEILGKGHSVRSIQESRRSRPMNQTAWEEFKALLLFLYRK
jgi:hypothetical protein